VKIEIKEKVIFEVAKVAQDLNIEIYVVGGYVRDQFLGRSKKDIDFSVVGDALFFANKLAEKFRVKPIIFERFRTAMIPYKGYQLEFVGTRKEEYTEGSRNPIVTEGTFYDDIKRRDFTVNALSISLNKDSFGELNDYFNGLEDLKNCILKTPLEPEITYSDDPLRMLRAARFASQLNFKLDSQSFEAITKMAPRIEIISQERISTEFLKIIESNNPSLGLVILHRTNLLKYIFPELNDLSGVEIIENESETYGHKDVFKHSLRVLDNILPNTDNIWLRFAALTHDIAKPKTKKFIKGVGWSFHAHEEFGARMMKKIFKRMKFPLEPLPYVEKLIRLHQRPMALVDDVVTDSAIRRLAANAGAELEDLFTLVRADITTRYSNKEEQYKKNYELVFSKIIEVQAQDKLREFQSPVRGEEIMEICNLQPSKAVGIIKLNIEEAILEGLIPNDYEEAKQYFIENKDKWLEEISNLEHKKTKHV